MKKFLVYSVASLFLFLVFPIQDALAGAPAILAPHSGWEYTFTNPTGDSSWNTSTGIGGIWSAGTAPFGNNVGGYSGDPFGFFDYATLWPADGTDGDDLWVRTAVDLSCVDLDTLTWNLGADNGFKLYMNGGLVASANAEGYTSQWEYSGNFASVTVNNGINVIAVALEDHGGLTAFDMQILGQAQDCQAIGGEIIQIDSTALLLAGAQTSIVWMMPVIVGIAGAGLLVYRLRK
jgi:hypothetical protein